MLTLDDRRRLRDATTVAGQRLADSRHLRAVELNRMRKTHIRHGVREVMLRLGISDDDRRELREATSEAQLRLGIRLDDLPERDDKPNDGMADSRRLANVLDAMREDE